MALFHIWVNRLLTCRFFFISSEHSKTAAIDSYFSIRTANVLNLITITESFDYY